MGTRRWELKNSSLDFLLGFFFGTVDCRCRLVELEQVLDVVPGSEEYGASFMDRLGHDVKDSLGSCSSNTPSLHPIRQCIHSISN